MMAFLSRNAFPILLGACLALALGGLFFRPDSGPETFPLMHPLLAVVTTTALVIAVRLLAPLLRIDTGDDHAD